MRLCCQALFKRLLAEPALQNVVEGTATTLAHARYLVLKNLAGSLVHDDATCQEALQLYMEASELDASDTVLWHRLGSLVSILQLAGFTGPAICDVPHL